MAEDAKPKSSFKIIHLATIFSTNEKETILVLKQVEDYRFVWFETDLQGNQTEGSVWGGTIADAIQNGRKFWSLNGFRIINCGFRYTLPERDEIGTNALFHQMVSSYQSMNGVYFDEELGSNCIVQNASLEARILAKIYK